MYRHLAQQQQEEQHADRQLVQAIKRGFAAGSAAGLTSGIHTYNAPAAGEGILGKPWSVSCTWCRCNHESRWGCRISRAVAL